MPNLNSNVPYDQIPHVVINHPETNAEHWAIMIVLYKILKDKNICIYPNQAISEKTRIPLRTVERRISELKKMGFIACTGLSFNRKISLGLLLNTSATMAAIHGEQLNTSAKIDISNRHRGGYSKNYTKKKKGDIFSTLEKQEIEWYKKNPDAKVKEEHEYLFAIKNPYV